MLRKEYELCFRKRKLLEQHLTKRESGHVKKNRLHKGRVRLGVSL